ncbi:MAG: hypothetical protein AAFR53_08700 [Pseudomonadota bacterium]
MRDLDINSNIQDLRRSMNDAARRQIPFVISLAVDVFLGEIKTHWEKQ